MKRNPKTPARVGAAVALAAILSMTACEPGVPTPTVPPAAVKPTAVAPGTAPPTAPATDVKPAGPTQAAPASGSAYPAPGAPAPVPTAAPFNPYPNPTPGR